MRRSVVASVFFHIAMFLLAWRLPAVTSRAPARAIEIDVQAHPEAPPPPRPEPPKPEPPRPEPPKLAMKTPRLERRQPEPEPPRQQLPPSPTPPPANPPPATPPGKVDLTLHALPGSMGGSVVLPATPPGGGTFGTGAQPPRKEWKPRGDAGDPLLGKIRETPTERFPLQKVGPDEFVYKGPQFSAHIQPDGSVSFDDKIIRDFNGTSGSWDLNDLIMKGKKQDPYRAEKEAFMRATEAQRDELAKKARGLQMRTSLARLPGHLESVWGDRRYSSKERRQTLFELWKDTAVGDNIEGQAGEEARGMIEAFIRKRLPEGSDDAYTPDELAMYARASHQRFQPYK